MKWFLYNVLFALAYCVVLPSFLLRMKRRGGYRARMGDRFARYPEEILSALRSFYPTITTRPPAISPFARKNGNRCWN